MSEEIPLVRTCWDLGLKGKMLCLTTVFVRWFEDVEDTMFVRMYAELWENKKLLKRWKYDSASLKVPHQRDIVAEHEKAVFVALMIWNWPIVVERALDERWPNEGDYDIPTPIFPGEDVFYDNLREVYERKVRDSAEGRE